MEKQFGLIFLQGNKYAWGFEKLLENEILKINVFWRESSKSMCARRLLHVPGQCPFGKSDAHICKSFCSRINRF